jgi:putative endonuclease
MTYVYLIESVHYRKQHYVGLTHDLKQRLSDHNAGRSIHTRKYKPWNLVAYLGFADAQTAHISSTTSKADQGKLS